MVGSAAASPRSRPLKPARGIKRRRVSTDFVGLCRVGVPSRGTSRAVTLVNRRSLLLLCQCGIVLGVSVWSLAFLVAGYIARRSERVAQDKTIAALS